VAPKIKISSHKIPRKTKLSHFSPSIYLTGSHGLPADFDIDTADSLGLKLVRGLVEEQLEGDLEIETEEGTAFRIRFQDIEYAARI
jgi:two-component sensor histidine kinase